MPRSKAAPTRKRALEDEPPIIPEHSVAALVEAAEVEGYEQRISSGSSRLHTPTDDTPKGLARAELPDEVFGPLKALHDIICRRVAGDLTGWGGVGDKSGRRRGYGYLASSPIGAEHYQRSHVMKEYNGAEADSDRAANRRASVLLAVDELPEKLHDALTALTALLRPLLPERYRALIVPAQLVAAQPNLHNGRRFLRPHLDEPLHDGFGVVIVTIAITGTANILIRARPWDEERREDVHFPLAPRQVYALSGEARNVCLHGVLAPDEGAARESLNLRFGLHSAERGGAFSAWEEIDCHWERDRESRAPGSTPT